MTITVISSARNNAELIVQCRDLGYLHDDWITLDPTYGKGAFWRLWRPRTLLRGDLDPARGVAPWDFTDLPFHTDEPKLGAITFDPPYKLNGTSTGLGPSASDVDYGVGGEYRTANQKMTLCLDGIKECMRVLGPGGHLLIKGQDQVVSGHKVWQTRVFADCAEQQGGRLVDQLHLVGMRKQPANRRQVHAHQNYSSLLIVRKNR